MALPAVVGKIHGDCRLSPSTTKFRKVILRCDRLLNINVGFPVKNLAGKLSHISSKASLKAVSGAREEASPCPFSLLVNVAGTFWKSIVPTSSISFYFSHFSPLFASLFPLCVFFSLLASVFLQLSPRLICILSPGHSPSRPPSRSRSSPPPPSSFSPSLAALPRAFYRRSLTFSTPPSSTGLHSCAEAD